MDYPGELPITAHREEIQAAIANSQVLVVAGETGSGKSTQLPKMILEMFSAAGIDGWIGHTQPRRIAARSVAERVASEIGTEIGGLVGFAVRFNDQVGSNTRIKVMTDGILLAEIQRDPLLSRYGALIIDEAHERSLNIDFLLGYLKALLPRRPELKLVITSATIDTARFAEHFELERAVAGKPGSVETYPAPVIEVSGRTFPVDIRYRPLTGDTDQIDGITAAVRELTREGPGDILIFLPGERDIRDTAEALNDLHQSGTEIVPLFSRLSAAEQHRIFASHRGRRIVLATNIAETSLTVPGIRYVIDPGTARISRYNQRTKVQRLPIEDVSQASANQRAGRCGRLGPGICIRLYSQEDFEQRDEFTDPEITRTNLASVILQMASLGIAGEGIDGVRNFPFVEPPDTRNIADGVRLLEELGALDPEPDEQHSWLTPRGARLARLPVDPRIARMIIAADDLNCLDPVLVISAAMSIQDPRETPSDNRDAARHSHARFEDPKSDLITLLHLWDYVNTERRNRSSGSFRRLCRSEFLNHNRVREWQDLYSQLKRVAKDLRLSPPIRRSADEVDQDAVHQAVLTGLLSQVGMRDDRPPAKPPVRGRKPPRSRPRAEYIGARSSRFVIGSGSVLSKAGPRWVMAGEMVETNRLYASMVAPVQPAWLEEAGGHMTSYSYADPQWSKARGTATVVERATLFGLPIVPGRTINLYRVDEALARELFIQHALVQREWETLPDARLHAFLDSNASVLAEAARWQAKTRVQDLEAETILLYSHYDRQIPHSVFSARHFEKWWKGLVDSQPDLLNIRLADLLPASVDAESFPDYWPGTKLALGYTFEPGSPVDGITVTIPYGEFAAVDTALFSWSVPGYRTELITELLRTLPKETRTSFIPLPDTASRIRQELDSEPLSNRGGTSLAEAVRLKLTLQGFPIERGLLRPNSVAAHLRPTFQVVDGQGELLAAGKDLDRLQKRLKALVRADLVGQTHPLEAFGLTAWPTTPLPRTATSQQLGVEVTVYPALADRGPAVDLVIVATPAEQAELHWSGVRRLIRLGLRRPARTASALLEGEAALALAGLANTPFAVTKAGFVDDMVNCAVDAVIEAAGGPPWTAAEMTALARFANARFPTAITEVALAAEEILEAANSIATRLSELADSPVDLHHSLHDARSQLRSLLFTGSLSSQGLGRLPAVGRYLTGLLHRVQHLPAEIDRDSTQLSEIRQLEADAAGASDPELVWMLQEMRVSLWAQHLGTDGPISGTRIRKRLAQS